MLLIYFRFSLVFVFSNSSSVWTLSLSCACYMFHPAFLYFIMVIWGERYRLWCSSILLLLAPTWCNYSVPSRFKLCLPHDGAPVSSQHHTKGECIAAHVRMWAYFNVCPFYMPGSNAFGQCWCCLSFVQTVLLVKLAPWSSALAEKLTDPQLLKRFLACYGTRRFVTAFTRARRGASLNLS